MSHFSPTQLFPFVYIFYLYLSWLRDSQLWDVSYENIHWILSYFLPKPIFLEGKKNPKSPTWPTMGRIASMPP